VFFDVGEIRDGLLEHPVRLPRLRLWRRVVAIGSCSSGLVLLELLVLSPSNGSDDLSAGSDGGAISSRFLWLGTHVHTSQILAHGGGSQS